MSAQKYPRLGVEEFGSLLLDSGDLDPVYLALSGAEFPGAQLRRWLVAYWCFYSAGLASWASEAEHESFWDRMEEAGENVTPSPAGTRWPRGRERRHFRGKTSARCLRELRRRYPEPEEMVRHLERLAPTDFSVFATAAKSHSGFGPWIAFKMADMLERLIGTEIRFDEAEVFMYREPRAAALKLDAERNGDGGDPEAAIARSVGYLRVIFGGRMAPPGYDRSVNLQELETVLCKWKSHVGGYYPVGNDIRELVEGVEPWATSSAAARAFLAGLSTSTDVTQNQSRLELA